MRSRGQLAGWMVGAFCVATGTGGEATHVFSVRPHGGRTHTLVVSESTPWITVRGNDATDLDCWIFDRMDVLVDADTDGTSCCTLRVRRPGRHRLMIENMGGRKNTYRLRQLATLP